MALDFPNSPSDGQVYTDTATGEQWVYESATNSWTSKGLVNTSGGLTYKGSVDITAAPPAASSGWQYSVLADGTANAGYGPGITGAVTKGDIIMYTGTGWTTTSHNVPQATAVVAGIDKKLWKKTGTALAPETAADTVQISAGTAALPGLTPIGDPNTGIYSLGADQLAISTNGTGRLFIDASGRAGLSIEPSAAISTHLQIGYGSVGSDHIVHNYDSYFANNLFKTGNSVWSRRSNRGGGLLRINDQDLTYSAADSGTAGAPVTLSERLRITADGKVGIGTTSPGSALEINASAATSPFIAKINNSEKARIDSSGRLLVGTSTSVGVGSGFESQLQIADTTVAMQSIANYRNDLNGPYLVFGKSRGSSVGTYSVVQADDQLGTIRFAGADGGDLQTNSASIAAFVDGTPGANNMPGRLVFSTTADGANSPTERMRIKSTGIVNIANAPVYADNTAAKAGGLVAGDIYRKADGTLMITF